MINSIDVLKNEAKKCLKCKKPQCVSKCPLNIDIPKIISLFEENENEAKNELLKYSNFSYICSNLCDHEQFCFGNCVLNKKDNGVKFYLIENYLASLITLEDYFKSSNKKVKVAVIGAGVSGLTCAIELAKIGCDVSIFEKNDHIGGVIYESLPKFRFDDSILLFYEKILKKLEISLHFNKELGNNLYLEDLKEYNIVILSLGTSISKKSLNSDYLIDGIEVLKKFKKGDCFIKNKNVLVIGGGNVALDVARTLNKDNNVQIVYRRDIKNAPSSKHELTETLNEGINFIELASPIEIITENNNVVGLKVQKNVLVDDINSSRKKFVGVDEFFTIPCDICVDAIGQNADYRYLKDVLSSLFNEDGWPKEGGITYENQTFFVTGDYYSGASFFSKAISLANETVKKVKDVI